ncbi:hypothetical protein H4582DRAFT_1959803, partial [Lactarius indigo]
PSQSALDPHDPAPWLLWLNDASLYLVRLGSITLFSQSRSPVPVVASASSLVLSSPFAPLSASSPHQASSCQDGKYIVDYVPVSHEDDGQDPARKSTDSDVEMRDVSHYGWDQGPLQSQPQPAGPSRSFSSPQFRVSYAACQRLPSSFPPSKPIHRSRPPPT